MKGEGWYVTDLTSTEEKRTRQIPEGEGSEAADSKEKGSSETNSNNKETSNTESQSNKGSGAANSDGGGGSTGGSKTDSFGWQRYIRVVQQRLRLHQRLQEEVAKVVPHLAVNRNRMDETNIL